jgi:hypothetical protein
MYVYIYIYRIPTCSTRGYYIINHLGRTFEKILLRFDTFSGWLTKIENKILVQLIGYVLQLIKDGENSSRVD